MRRRGEESDWEFYRVVRVGERVLVRRLFGFPGDIREEPVMRRPWDVLARIRGAGVHESAMAFGRKPRQPDI